MQGARIGGPLTQSTLRGHTLIDAQSVTHTALSQACCQTQPVRWQHVECTTYIVLDSRSTIDKTRCDLAGSRPVPLLCKADAFGHARLDARGFAPVAAPRGCTHILHLAPAPLGCRLKSLPPLVTATDPHESIHLDHLHLHIQLWQLEQHVQPEQEFWTR